jgi:hypothetical protein
VYTAAGKFTEQRRRKKVKAHKMKALCYVLHGILNLQGMLLPAGCGLVESPRNNSRYTEYKKTKRKIIPSQGINQACP